MFPVIFDKMRLNDASPANDTKEKSLRRFFFLLVFPFFIRLIHPVTVGFSFHYQITDHFVAKFV